MKRRFFYVTAMIEVTCLIYFSTFPVWADESVEIYSKEDDRQRQDWVKDVWIGTYGQADGGVRHHEYEGNMEKGWWEEGGRWYYLHADRRMSVGWVQEGEEWYYLQADGRMSVGWLQVGEEWYYFQANGQMSVGWLQVGEDWYYLQADGRMAVGWLQVGEDWYYLQADGRMAVGWLQMGEDRYYLQADGRMAVGWLQMGEDWYYLQADGRMAVGWLQMGEDWYYLCIDGRMVVGWIETGEKWYYLDLRNGAMLSDAVTPDGYQVGTDGACMENKIMRKTTAPGAGFSGGGSAGKGNAKGSSPNGSDDRESSTSGNADKGSTDVSGPAEDVKDATDLKDEDLCAPSLPFPGDDSQRDVAAWDTITGASPSDARKVRWQVHFTDEKTPDHEILKQLSGEIREGDCLSISFPEIVLGADGAIWEALESSPWEFHVYGPGIQKYVVRYRKKEEVQEKPDPDEEAARRLEAWNQAALQDDELLPGGGQGIPVGEPWILTRQKDCERRIRGIISRVDDSGWHPFYLIGKNYTPEALLIGEYMSEGAYSCTLQDEFNIGTDHYLVYRAGFRKVFKEEDCSHAWETGREDGPFCLSYGRKSLRCRRCEKEEAVLLPPKGHADENGDSVCDLCGNPSGSGTAERLCWKTGDVVAGRFGDEEYLFRCIDEDYTDGGNNHTRSALFLCDRLIRSDVDQTKEERKELTFGANNNYKKSYVRAWLGERERDLGFQLSPTLLGGETAYVGSTGADDYGQLEESALESVAIGSQWMQDRLFILSVDEALRYKEFLWKFNGSEEDNADACYSSYSKGYWLRSPMDGRGEDGAFRYGGQVYVVDLLQGNIHPTAVSSESIGIRPAFVLPQL